MKTTRRSAAVGLLTGGLLVIGFAVPSLTPADAATAPSPTTQKVSALQPGPCAQLSPNLRTAAARIQRTQPKSAAAKRINAVCTARTAAAAPAGDPSSVISGIVDGVTTTVDNLGSALNPSDPTTTPPFPGDTTPSDPTTTPSDPSTGPFSPGAPSDPTSPTDSPSCTLFCPPGQQSPPPGQQSPPPGQQSPPPGHTNPPPVEQNPPTGTTPPQKSNNSTVTVTPTKDGLAKPQSIDLSSGLTTHKVAACPQNMCAASDPATSTDPKAKGKTLANTGAPAGAVEEMLVGALMVLGGAIILGRRRRTVTTRP